MAVGGWSLFFTQAGRTIFVVLHMTSDLFILAIPLFVVAVLYSSVGHAGASGYVAVLALSGMAAAEIKPVALVWNVGVAVVATAQFARAGYFSWRLFWPLALASVPMAYVAGGWRIPGEMLKPLLGVVLIFSAVRLFWKLPDPDRPRFPSRAVALATGGLLGGLAGMTGTGGGIFLTPVMLFRRWAITRQVAAVSAAFVLVNSLSGLAGHWQSGQPIPRFALWLAPVVMAGGLIGSTLGSRRWPVRTLHLILAVVLLAAGLKLCLLRPPAPPAATSTESAHPGRGHSASKENRAPIAGT